MLQKFALAFKTKTIEFFADEDDDASAAADADADDLSLNLTLPAADEIITGQHVVVLKPDAPPPLDPAALVPSLLATLSSFRAAYLHLQTAHSPLDPSAISAADRLAVSHLRRLSDLKHSLSNPNPNPSLSSLLQSQVQDNQALLRTYGSLINRLQSDIDDKDAAAAALTRTLADLETSNSKLERRLSPPDDNVEALLSVSVFDSVLKDSYRATHHFTVSLIALMEQCGWELRAAADSIYPDAVYAKPRHCKYAIMSYICLGMFGGFGSEDLGAVDVDDRRLSSLRQFIEHSAIDPVELLNGSPNCEFALFCRKKYEEVVTSGIKASQFGNLDHQETLLESLTPSNPLYEPFVSMASSVWMLHKLALAYDPVVEIFLAARGAEFSMVYMERVNRSAAPAGGGCGKTSQPKVEFAVVPGFRVGKTVIQCRVYLDK